MELTALVILLALIQYIWFTIRVGAAREKYGVEAPRTTGDENWQRIFRGQQNTLEQLIVFIPGTLIFGAWFQGPWVLVPGLIFLVGRQLYSMEYVKDPKTRLPGMSLTFLANAILLVGIAIGLVLRLI